MDNHIYFPKRIYIEKDCIDFPLTERVLENAYNVPYEVIDSGKDLIDSLKLSVDALVEGKKNLLISRQRGDFVKPCPCTPHYIGCNYFIINLDINCPLNCTYCILQHYLSNPLVTILVNTEDLWKQLDSFIIKNKNKIVRIGTGELGDSLVLDHLTERSKDLICYFKQKNNVLFELKTKTVNIKNILESEVGGNIIIAWSLNSCKIVQEEEMGTPSVWERINAARNITRKGFRVAFHFDPLILYPGWEEGYAEVIDKMLTDINPSKVAWISLGSLRFSPDLKQIIKMRYPSSKIICGEFIIGKDGKFRYFKPLRMELYRKIISYITKGYKERVPIYFCMETEEVWRKILYKKPRSKKDIEKYLTSPLGTLARVNKTRKSKL